ncbi:MAG: YfhO family protein, partial [Oscillospiraceae bacterium]|nr:YfhO family protein [Oscillospiraceae bacterium]
SSSATSSNMPEDIKTYFNMFDFVANHLPSVEPTIRSSGDNVLPNVYCGLISLLLIPAYFISDKIRGKEKIMAVALIGVFYISFNINILNYIWHGFHFPNDLPYRYSFAYSFVLLLLAYKAMANIREFSRKYFVVTGIGLFAFVILIDKLSSKNVDNYTITLSIIFAVAYVILAGLITSNRFSVKTLETMLIFVIVVEICSATSVDFVMSQSKSAYTSDYTAYQEIKEKTEQDDSELFYRTELTKLRARMDPSWYGYNGVSVFSSMAYENTSALMKSLGLFGNKINSYTYYPQTPVFNSFFSLRYLYDNNSMLSENSFYSYVDTTENFTSYKYNYYLPLAFSVSSDISDWDQLSSSNPFTVQNELVKSATGIDAVFKDISATDVSSSNIETLSLSTVNTGVTFSTNKINKSKSGNVTITIDVAEAGQYYVYAGSIRLSSIKFTAGDDYSYNYVSSSIQPFILDLGRREAGEEITIEYTVADSHDTASLTFCAAMLNEQNFNNAYNKIKSNGTIELTEFKETSFSGNINVSNDNAFIFTSIPYDESWNIYVDGEKLSYVSDKNPDGSVVSVGNGLIGFDISKGDHTIRFEYKANGLKQGIAFTCVGIIIAALLLVYKFTLKKKRAASGKRSEYFAVIPKEVE